MWRVRLPLVTVMVAERGRLVVVFAVAETPKVWELFPLVRLSKKPVPEVIEADHALLEAVMAMFLDPAPEVKLSELGETSKVGIASGTLPAWVSVTVVLAVPLVKVRVTVRVAVSVLLFGVIVKVRLPEPEVAVGEMLKKDVPVVDLLQLPLVVMVNVCALPPVAGNSIVGLSVEMVGMSEKLAVTAGFADCEVPMRRVVVAEVVELMVAPPPALVSDQLVKV